jgi:Ca2+-binding RTX toxin-like protein
MIGLGAVLVSLALGAAPASATFTTVLASDGTLVIIGDDLNDDITLTCLDVPPPNDRLDTGFYTEPSGGPISCATIERVQATLGGGNDVLYLGEFSFFQSVGTFSGTSVDTGTGNDQIVAMQGQPSATFNPGGTFVLGPGNDSIYGGFAADVMLGGPGADFVAAGDGLNQVKGGVGGDTLKGGVNRDRISGEQGPDHIDGNPGPDLLSGGAGNDKILGDKGRDRIRPGPGRNLVRQGGSDLSEFF